MDDAELFSITDSQGKIKVLVGFGAKSDLDLREL